MKILWFSWKDIKNPQAGGAEIITHEICKRLSAEGHEVVRISMGFKNASKEEFVDGVKIIRVGTSRFTVQVASILYYLKNLRGKFDLIVEEINTAPYFLSLFKKQEKVVLFFHQLAREIWFYEAPALSPIFYPTEAIYLRFLSLFKTQVITVSNSTKSDLKRYGFKEKNIKIISEGIALSPLESLEKCFPKEEKFTILFFSALRKMKRPMDALKAFEIFHKRHQESVFWVASDGQQRKEMEEFIKQKEIENSVKFWGRVSEEQKKEIMQRAHILISTSVKEGWGLIVTEANSQGTPAIVYDVDGLRDSVFKGEIGWISKSNLENLAEKIEEVYKNKEEYEKFRNLAYEKSKSINFEESYKDFKRLIVSNE